MRKLTFVVLALSLLSGPALADEKCHLLRVTSLDMGSLITHVTVPASINDQPLTMLVDTGSPFTMISESKAKAVGLRTEIAPDFRVIVFGGIVIRHYATFAGFTLGTMKAPSFTYPLLPDGIFPSDVDGILGADFLANFDLDFDFAKAKLSLFSRDHCDGKVVYWTHEPVERFLSPRTKTTTSSFTFSSTVTM